MYEILNEIVKLKKETNNKYAPRSLEWESDLNITGDDIRFIFAYQYITDYTKSKIQEGLIDDYMICRALKSSSILRNPMRQNSFVNKVINKEVKPSMISEFRTSEIKLLTEGKLKLKQDDNYFFVATKTIRSIKCRIKQRQHLLNESPFRNELIGSIRELYNLIKIYEGKK
jgi:hypothetical protein